MVVAPSLELYGDITVCASAAGFDEDAVHCVITEADGRFAIPAGRLHDLISGCRVGASAPGAMPAVPLRTVCAGELSQPLVLERPGYAIAGTVVDHFGGPVAGARVLGDLRSGAAKAVTDEAGRFELWTSNGLLSVSGSGYGSVTSIGPAPDPQRRIELYPEAVLEGTVWGSDGTTRAGVQVRLHSGRVPEQVTHSDADGSFQFAGLEPGEFRIRAVEESLGAGPTPVRVPMGETVVVDLELEPRATLVGQVLFASGEPCSDLSGVQVTRDGHRYQSQQIGAASGEYSIAGLSVGSYKLEGGCTEAAADVKATIEIPAAEVIHYDVVLAERGASISGRVDVREPRLWLVHALRASSDPKHVTDPGWRSEWVSPAGEFSIANLGEGTWRLNLRQAGSERSLLRDGPGTEVVVGREDVTGVWLSPPAEHAVTLSLINEAGEAVRGRSAQVYRVDEYIQSCTTGEDGTCAASLPSQAPHGQLTVSVPGRRILCAGEWRSGCAIHVDEGPIEMMVEDVTTLEGRLSEERDGAPLSFALIRAVRFDDGREFPAASTRTEEDGTFVLPDLPAGASMQLKVTCPAGVRPPIYLPLGSTPSVACD